MKIECEKSRIEPVILKAARLTNKHLTLPVLSCIYLETDGNKLIIKSTNLDMGLEVEVKVKVLEGGSVAVPAQILLNIISQARDNNLSLETIEGNLKVTSSKNSALIKCMSSEDFPTIPKLISDVTKDTKSLKINCHDLLNGFKSVWYSASTSNVKPELSSVYIYKSNNNLIFVSTDSFRLAEKKISVKADVDFPQVLIPFRNVSELIKLFEDVKSDIEIIFEKNQAAFILDDLYVVSRLVDGNFPDYKQIIPKSYPTTITLLKQDFLNSVKTSNIFSDTLNQVKLGVDVKNKSLNIESKNSDIGEYKESVKATVEGEPLELNFNNKYVTDCMQSIFSDSLQLSFGGVGKPLAIAGTSDRSFLYIVMPMNR